MCVVGCEWSPDSRWFLISTTRPRLVVDNGIKLFKYNGTGPVLSLERSELYTALWKPVPPKTYPTRSLTPGAKGPTRSAVSCENSILVLIHDEAAVFFVSVQGLCTSLSAWRRP